jgi:hypothetical protein
MLFPARVATCLHQNLERRTRELETSKSCIGEESIRQGSVSADFEDGSKSAIFVDNVSRLRGISEKTCRTLQERKY